MSDVFTPMEVCAARHDHATGVSWLAWRPGGTLALPACFAADRGLAPGVATKLPGPGLKLQGRQQLPPTKHSKLLGRTRTTEHSQVSATLNAS
ncbi:hypothetical protein GQ55_5G430500 [Panicum hallii var. hallii]|uniref:Uncharacterized protein n=1 Tax=Panicum hallii var. hallii TaxID=1504633 RepID=A0A2T7DPC9_9POAL|nr:hypothetical protein GQ55_5G430500 [Panicum hallii var. hallii]